MVERLRKIKTRMNVVFLGDVDSGKSTIIGQLLYKLNSIEDRVYKKCVETATSMGKEDCSYAFIVDKTKAER